jgi:hypothetical protein
MEDLKAKAKSNSLFISLLYVGLGTISVLCSYPPYYGDWVLITLLFTFPVSIFGFGVMMAGKYYLMATAIQLVVFCVFWYIFYNFLLKKYIKLNKEQ